MLCPTRARLCVDPNAVSLTPFTLSFAHPPILHTQFTKMVELYLSEAPTGADTSQVPMNQRFHGQDAGARVTAFRKRHATTAGKLIWGNEIFKGDPLWMNHTRIVTASQFHYTDAVLKGDRRVSYKSDRFPWIESAFRYDVRSGAAFDMDMVRVNVPGRKGSGHYVVNWRWSGYYDCIDVDYFDNKKVDNPDGILTNGDYTWTKVDHCQYVDPQRVVSGCLPANDDAAACRDAITLQEYSNNLRDTSGSSNGGQKTLNVR